jgi:hypothetical protein
MYRDRDIQNALTLFCNVQTMVWSKLSITSWKFDRNYIALAKAPSSSQSPFSIEALDHQHHDNNTSDYITYDHVISP